MFLELDGLLTHDVLRVEGGEDGFASGLEPGDLLPDDGDDLEHVFTVEVFDEFLLDELEAFDGLGLIGLNQSDHSSLLMGHHTGSFLVGIVCDGYVKVDNVDDVLEWWGSLGVPSVKLDDHIELANVEEVNDRLSLILGHVGSTHERLHVESVEEDFDPVSLDDVLCEYDSLAFNNGHFEESEQEDVAVEAGLTNGIEVLCSLEPVDASSFAIFSLL